MACIEEKLLTVVLNLSRQKGWITASEKHQIEIQSTYHKKRIAISKLLFKIKCGDTDDGERLLLCIRCIDDMNTQQHPERDENRFLLKLMSKLFENDLATAQEVLECEEQEEKKFENVELTDSTTRGTQGFVHDVGVAGIIKHPLLLSAVIKCVLKYLNFCDIKNSRLICKEWASDALRVLIPRSKITFNKSANNRDPLSFFEVFSNRNEENKLLTFRNFEWSACLDVEKPWIIEELNFFFRNQQQHITELRLSTLYLVNSRGRIYSFDITPWISTSPNTIANSKLKTFYFCADSPDDATELSIQSRALSNVNDLVLDGGKVNLQDGVQISPIRLKIQHSVFTRYGENLADLCVNDFVNFINAKYVHLLYRYYYLKPSETKLSLDLSGCLELECLDLTNIEIRNWTTSKWTVEKLKLVGIPVEEPTQMEIQELDFVNSQIDICVLPQSLEKLVIGGICGYTPLCTQPIILHNLKVLKLSQLTTYNVSTFFQNGQFPNLESLDMESDGNVQVTVAWLSTSTSVKILKLNGITIKNCENKNLNLDKLILQGYRPTKIIQMCGSHIQAKELVVDYHRDYLFDEELLHFLESQKSNQDCGQRIYFSDMNKIIKTNAENPVVPLGSDREYYLFEKNVWKSIGREEFDKLLLI